MADEAGCGSRFRFILGSRVDATNYDAACDLIQRWAEARQSRYVIAANVHVVMTAYWQPAFQQIVNQAALVTPDGMPLVWALRLLGVVDAVRVYGPDLMLAWCDRAARSGVPLYLYGGTPTMLEKLSHQLTGQFPGLAIVGCYAPPFRPLTPAEEAADAARILASGARVVLVGLGCPKQEQWMARQQEQLPLVMIGVGAAFSFHSGEVSQAPRWMMAWGLEWLYRLLVEPRRLWRRYLINNPVFVVLLGWQLLQYWLMGKRSN
ncbi:WecB/TagA/CpsF family glycosyltransferase [Trichothermofontia sichuanensis B231]|uniref:WecB/TagA/CpsF family glycosyltransferase n=1 Tax=Trichothermofontia sichuanensis TaxID=3045816 RepID=UPI0022454EAD|nr:WecB/TagA/CpsF family glycosyltransferase [Trichothermofontia sichuanensis]UZQ55480.1 WecB/TagA/CpsF family glycosyltransferase [Trichothermofontia sichuanensis B231]